MPDNELEKEEAPWVRQPSSLGSSTPTQTLTLVLGCAVFVLGVCQYRSDHEPTAKPALTLTSRFYPEPQAPNSKLPSHWNVILTNNGDKSVTLVGITRELRRWIETAHNGNSTSYASDDQMAYACEEEGASNLDETSVLLPPGEVRTVHVNDTCDWPDVAPPKAVVATLYFSDGQKSKTELERSEWYYAVGGAK